MSIINICSQYKTVILKNFACLYSIYIIYIILCYVREKILLNFLLFPYFSSAVAHRHKSIQKYRDGNKKIQSCWTIPFNLYTVIACLLVLTMNQPYTANFISGVSIFFEDFMLVDCEKLLEIADVRQLFPSLKVYISI